MLRQRTGTPVVRDWARADSSSAASRCASRSSWVCDESRMAKLDAGRGERDDGDHHQQLQQREAAQSRRPPWRKRPWRAAHQCGSVRYCQLPMSASLPSPPGWPSAPNDITSISPLTPGLRYW